MRKVVQDTDTVGLCGVVCLYFVLCMALKLLNAGVDGERFHVHVSRYTGANPELHVRYSKVSIYSVHFGGIRVALRTSVITSLRTMTWRAGEGGKGGEGGTGANHGCPFVRGVCIYVYNCSPRSTSGILSCTAVCKL